MQLKQDTLTTATTQNDEKKIFFSLFIVKLLCSFCSYDTETFVHTHTHTQNGSQFRKKKMLKNVQLHRTYRAGE